MHIDCHVNINGTQWQYSEWLCVEQVYELSDKKTVFTF